jgi:serine/threonine protein kinase
VLLPAGHDIAADIWSIGVIMYVLLTGEQPFYAEDLVGVSLPL